MTRTGHAIVEHRDDVHATHIDIDASPSAAMKGRAEEDAEDDRVARALETFSTRLTNVKHAISTDVHKALVLARHGATQIDALTEALEERLFAMEARLERLEARAFGRVDDEDDDDNCDAQSAETRASAGVVKMLDNAAFETATTTTGRHEGTWASPASVATCANAVTSGILRVAAACAFLWIIFWITIALAVLVDDRELTRELASSARWKNLFWDEIFTVMA